MGGITGVGGLVLSIVRVEGVLGPLHHGVKSHTRAKLAEPRISTIPFFRGIGGMVELGRHDH